MGEPLETTIMSKYKEDRDKLIGIYSDIKNDGLFSDEKQKIEEKIENLKQERFIMAVAGQIKAGKSSLLNALIFRDNILPVNDTPHTAKITIISYSEKPSATITYFTSVEFDRLRNDAEFMEFNKADIEKSISEHKLHPEKFLGKEEILENIYKLSEYIAKNGKYTPFVKKAEIRYPSEILEYITVVDTPGTNDTNRYRSQITKDWIHQADAVIYVTYAGKVLDAEDEKFINKYLQGVLKENFIVVVNKMDSISDKSDLKNYVEDLVKKSEFKDFFEGLTYVYTSSLGALTKIIKSDGKKLNSDQGCFERECGSNGKISFIEDDGETGNGFSSILDAINQNLIGEKKSSDHTGKKIIDAHKLFILKGLIEYKLKKLETEKSKIEDSIENLRTNKKKLQDNLKKFDEQHKELDHYFQEKHTSLNNNIIAALNISKGNIESTIIKIKDKTKTELESRELKQFRGILWKIQDILADHFKEIRNESSELQKKLEEVREKIIRELKHMVEDLPYRNVKLIINQSISEGLDFMSKKIIEEVFSSKNIGRIIENSTNWFQRSFSTNGGKILALDEIMINFGKELSDNTSNIFKDFIRQVISANEEWFKKLKESLAIELNRLEKEIEKIESGKIDVQYEIEEKFRQNEVIKKDIERINGLKESVSGKII